MEILAHKNRYIHIGSMGNFFLATEAYAKEDFVYGFVNTSLNADVKTVHRKKSEYNDVYGEIFEKVFFTVYQKSYTV